MKISAITMAIWLVLATSAAAQGPAGGKQASPEGSSKTPLSQVRALANELQGHADKLGDLMTVYRSIVERRPQSQGGSPEQKKADDEELAKWSAAVERHLKRIEETRALVIETLKRLDQATQGLTLPTGLAKDVANARNEADAQRATADQAIKSKPKTASKRAKPAPKDEKPAPELPDDLDL